MQAPDALLEPRLLVVDGHDDVDLRAPSAGVPAQDRRHRERGHAPASATRVGATWEHAESSLRAGRRTTNAAPPPGAFDGLDPAVVGVDDRRDDGEAQAGAAAAALAAALRAPEALEQRVGVVGRQARAVVAHGRGARGRPRARR